MANDFPTTTDSVADALDLTDIEVSDLLNGAPFVGRLPMVESSNGTTHKYSKETAAPVVGFRAENDGREYDHGVDTVVTVTLKILDWSCKVDVAVADAWRKGGREAYLRRQALRHLRAAFYAYELQVINGTIDGSAAGFTGFANVLDDSDDAMVVNAGGTTADTASSVYAVRLSEDHVAGVMKGDGLVDIGEVSIVPGAGSATGELPVYYQPASTWLGIQVGSAYSFGRICNLTADSGKGLTDDLISDLLSEFPAGYEPNLLLMNRRSLKQLQQSRTATSQSGAPAPFPEESFGIPIQKVESIINTEALLTAA